MSALENIMMGVEFSEIVACLNVAKTEKMPYIKMCIMKFAEQAIRTTYIDALEELVDVLAPLAVKVSEEKDAPCRESALVVLGVLQARVPDSMGKFIDPLIAQKKEKITAAKETVSIGKYDKSEKKAAAAAAAAKKKEAAAAKAKPAAKPKAAAMEFDDDDAFGGGGGGFSKPLAKKPALGGRPKKAAAAAPDAEETKAEESAAPKRGGPPAPRAAKAPAAASGPIKTIKASDIVEEDLGPGMSKETAIEKVTGFYDAQYVNAFEEAKW